MPSLVSGDIVLISGWPTCHLPPPRKRRLGSWARALRREVHGWCPFIFDTLTEGRAQLGQIHGLLRARPWLVSLQKGSFAVRLLQAEHAWGDRLVDVDGSRSLRIGETIRFVDATRGRALAQSPISGLRAHKLARTRAALIEAAVEMCVSRGYENTTVEHIAAAAEVSSRTFARYFVNKDAVFVAILDGLAEEVAAELRALPAELGPLAAMRAALGAALAPAHRARSHSLAGDGVARIVRVVTSCEPLRRAAIDYRDPQVLAAMAHRMGVGTEDPRLALAMALIGVTVMHAFSTVTASGVPLDSVAIGQEVDRIFIEFATLAADLTVKR